MTYVAIVSVDYVSVDYADDTEKRQVMDSHTTLMKRVTYSHVTKTNGSSFSRNNNIGFSHNIDGKVIDFHVKRRGFGFS